jgi:DNA polymerase V
LALPLYLSAVSAGFPSPADDFLDRPLDLNEHLIRNPAATFFVRVSGNSMLRAGIHNGDILIVDRSLDPTPGRIVIAAVDGELTVKRLVQEGERWLLVAENDGYPAIALDEVGDSLIWGVVRHVSVPNFYGTHGYDPTLSDMSAIFFAADPDFVQGTLNQVRNIDIAVPDRIKYGRSLATLAG